MNFNHLIFNASDVSIEEALMALDENNCIQIRRAFDPDMVRLERNSYARAASRNANCRTPLSFFHSLIKSSSNIEYNMINGLRADPLFSIFSRKLRSDTISIPAHYATSIRTIRACPPDNLGNYYQELNAEPMHQDSRCHNPTSFGSMIVVWILMYPDSAGSNKAPSLRLLPGPVNEFLPIEDHPVHPINGGLEISHELTKNMRDTTGEWIPDIEIGDAIIFTGYCPHGTYIGPDMAQNRLSCELKVFSHSERIVENFYGDPDINPNHFILKKRFTLGPTHVRAIPIVNPGHEAMTNQLHSRPPSNLSFDFAGIGDDQIYSVANHSQELKKDDSSHTRQNGPLVVTGRPGAPIWPLVEVLRPQHTGRNIIIDPIDIVQSRPFDGSPIFAGLNLFGVHERLQSKPNYITILAHPLTTFLAEHCPNPTNEHLKALENFVEEAGDLNRTVDYFSEYSTWEQQFDQSSSAVAHDAAPDGDGEDFSEKLAKAIYHLENDFCLVGIEEMYAETVFLLFNRYNWGRVALPNNPTSNFADAGDSWLSDDLREKIEAKIRGDMEIYNHFRAKLENLANQVAFGSALDEYREDCQHLNVLISASGRMLENYNYVYQFRHLLKDTDLRERFTQEMNERGLSRRQIRRLLEELVEEDGRVILENMKNDINVQLKNSLSRNEARIFSLELLLESQKNQIKNIQNANTELLRQKLEQQDLLTPQNEAS